MTGREQAIRFAELLFAGRPDGSLIAVSIAPEWDRPHCVRAPGDVADYAAGTGDVYVRHSPIRERPPRGKRGDERLTAALLGIFQDLDVNGSPDGRGGTVAGACPNREAALELAHALLEPTLTVNSGYGVQTFHLLDAPLVIANDDDLEAARALTFGWAEHMKRLAGERGMTKLDPVGDLTRVVRVPGSFNTKGATPVPVELDDDGGARYPLEQLRSFAAANGRPKPQPAAPAAGTANVAEAILERHPDLDRLARRKGKKPGKGSASEWDFALACRAAEDHGLDDAALEALIRHARALHNDPKGERDDYVERTVANVRRRVGRPGADVDGILGELTELLEVGQVGLRVTDVAITGDGGDAVATIELDDDTPVYFERLDHVARSDKLANQLSAAVGVWTEFTPLQARRAAALMRRYVGRAAVVAERSRVVELGLELLDAAELDEFTFADQTSRWDAWRRLDNTDPSAALGSDAYAAKVVVPRDTAIGNLYVRAGWMQEFARRRGTRHNSSGLAGLLEHVGWHRPGGEGRIKATDPAGADAPLVWSFYVVPGSWLDAHKADENGPGDGG